MYSICRLEVFSVYRVNFKQPYLLGSLAKSDEIDLHRKLRKSDCTWFNFQALWSYLFGDMEQNVQHMQAGADSAACGKSLLLTYDPMPSPRNLFMHF